MGSALTHAVGWRYACRGRGNAPRSSSKGLLSACDNASTPGEYAGFRSRDLAHAEALEGFPSERPGRGRRGTELELEGGQPS